MLSDDQLRIALYEQPEFPRSSGEGFGAVGFVTEATIRDALSEYGGTSVIDLRKVSVDPDVLSKISIDVAKRYNVFPVAFKEEENVVVLAVANPNDMILADQIRAFLGGGVRDLNLWWPKSRKSCGRSTSITAWS